MKPPSSPSQNDPPSGLPGGPPSELPGGLPSELSSGLPVDAATIIRRRDPDESLSRGNTIAQSGSRADGAAGGSHRSGSPTALSRGGTSSRGGMGDQVPGPTDRSPAAVAQVLVGHRLNHFYLEKLIGGGGMGAVFRARDEQLDRTVAVKVVPFANSDTELQRRFRNEAQSAAKLDHPHIAQVFDVGSDDPWHYIVFEFIGGINLRELVRRDGVLRIDDAVLYTIQLADALQHAADRGITHRDVKPSNVVLSGERIKLVDMGLARSEKYDLSTDMTASGVTLGTFDYISPEQARDPRDADIRSDLYSLGCTLFFMLTGRPPYAGGTMLQKLLAHGNMPPPDVREFRRGVSEELSATIARLLAKDPDDRFQSPTELIDSLHSAASRQSLRRLRRSNANVPTTPAWQHWVLSGTGQRTLPWIMGLAALVSIGLVLQVQSWMQPSDIVMPEGLMPPVAMVDVDPMRAVDPVKRVDSLRAVGQSDSIDPVGVTKSPTGDMEVDRQTAGLERPGRQPSGVNSTSTGGSIFDDERLQTPRADSERRGAAGRSGSSPVATDRANGGALSRSESLSGFGNEAARRDSRSAIRSRSVRDDAAAPLRGPTLVDSDGIVEGSDFVGPGRTVRRRTDQSNPAESISNGGPAVQSSGQLRDASEVVAVDRSIVGSNGSLSSVRSPVSPGASLAGDLQNDRFQNDRFRAAAGAVTVVDRSYVGSAGDGLTADSLFDAVQTARRQGISTIDLAVPRLVTGPLDIGGDEMTIRSVIGGTHVIVTETSPMDRISGPMDRISGPMDGIIQGRNDPLLGDKRDGGVFDVSVKWLELQDLHFDWTPSLNRSLWSIRDAERINLTDCVITVRPHTSVARGGGQPGDEVASSRAAGNRAAGNTDADNRAAGGSPEAVAGQPSIWSDAINRGLRQPLDALLRGPLMSTPPADPAANRSVGPRPSACQIFEVTAAVHSQMPSVLCEIEMNNVIVRGHADMVRAHQPSRLDLSWDNGLLAISGAMVRSGWTVDRETAAVVGRSRIDLTLEQLVVDAGDGVLRVDLTAAAAIDRDDRGELGATGLNRSPRLSAPDSPIDMTAAMASNRVEITRAARKCVFVISSDQPHVSINLGGEATQSVETQSVDSMPIPGWLQCTGSRNAYDSNPQLDDPLLRLRTLAKTWNQPVSELVRRSDDDSERRRDRASAAADRSAGRSGTQSSKDRRATPATRLSTRWLRETEPSMFVRWSVDNRVRGQLHRREPSQYESSDWAGAGLSRKNLPLPSLYTSGG